MVLLLSPEAYKQLLEVSIVSLAPNTQHAYASGLLHFTRFCNSHEVSENLRMPTSSELLAAFLGNLAAHHVSYDCTKNWMLGLHFWHSLHGAPWNGKTSQVDIVRKGVKKLVPAQHPPHLLLCSICMHYDSTCPHQIQKMSLSWHWQKPLLGALVGWVRQLPHPCGCLIPIIM